ALPTSPKLTSTWLSTTSLHTSNPAAVSPSANRRASAQHRSTRSATPDRPSSRRAAHTANPRARRDDSAVKSARVGSPPDPTRYEAEYDIAAAWTSGREQNAKPQSYGTLSHLCPSHAHESASSTPSTRWRVAGLAAAHSPKAPSTWTHAPCSCATSQPRRRSSHAPVLTLPACRHTMVGPAGPAASCRASAA